jgi:hypothetical protein
MSNEHPNGKGLPRTPRALLPDAQGGTPPLQDQACRPTYSPAFPLAEANDWISRWRKADGGFFCHPQPDGSVMVQLAYKHEHGPEAIEEALDKIQPLQNELFANPDLKSAVCTLIADTWHMASQRPAGSA